MSAQETRSALRDALRAGVLLACAELLLARLSDAPQWPRDVLLSGLACVLATLAAAGLALRLPWPAPLRDAGPAACVALPTAGVAAAIAALRLRHEAPLLALVGAAALFAGIVGVAGWRARVRRSPSPSPALVIAGVAAAAVVSWGATAPPEAGIALALAGGWTLLLLASRRPLGWGAAAVAVIALSLTPFELRSRFPAPPRRGPVPAGPDIVLIVVDTLRADDARRMETWRKLAAEGVAYEQVQAGGSWTLPSMASLLTGAPVARHGAGRMPGKGRLTSSISPELPTLAERLSEAGYDTAAILAMNPFLDARLGFGRGFDYYDLGGRAYHRGALPTSTDGVSRPVVVQALLSASRRIQSPALQRWLGVGARKAVAVQVDYAREWLAQRSERPFFLWLHAMEPHLPYFHLAETGLAAEAKRVLLNRSRPDILDDPRFEQEEWRALLRRAYREEIARLDRSLLDLLAALGPPRERGRVVVLVSDHGEEFFEQGGFEHGHAFYEPVVSVPLVFAGVEPGRLRDAGALVGHMDVAPTLLELAGLAPPDAGGRSLLHEGPPRPMPSQNLLYGHGGRAVRLGDWKLIEIDGREELYHLATDPGEHRNLVKSRPEAERLRRLLPAAGPRGEAIAPTRAEREMLEALGYVE